MAESWLKTNRRALLLGMIPPAAVSAMGVGGLAWAIATGQSAVVHLIVVIIAVAPLWLVGQVLYVATQPRIGYEVGELLVFVEPARPTRVPIDLVECFFLGQGASELPKLNGREPETQNVVVRLAESAAEWKHRDVRPAFGHWCEGYITIRGAWCEPLTPALMRKLNHRLAEVHRERKGLVPEESHS